jgi:hypothetical protein
MAAADARCSNTVLPNHALPAILFGRSSKIYADRCSYRVRLSSSLYSTAPTEQAIDVHRGLYYTPITLSQRWRAVFKTTSCFVFKHFNRISTYDTSETSSICVVGAKRGFYHKALSATTLGILSGVGGAFMSHDPTNGSKGILSESLSAVASHPSDTTMLWIAGRR